MSASSNGGAENLTHYCNFNRPYKFLCREAEIFFILIQQIWLGLPIVELSYESNWVNRWKWFGHVEQSDESNWVNRWKWFGHVEQSDESNWVKICMNLLCRGKVG